MRTLLPVLGLSLLVACGGSTPEGTMEAPVTDAPAATPETPAAPAPQKAAEPPPPQGDLPTPYSAEAIRDASKVGRTWEFRVTEGTSTQWQIMEMTVVDADGAVVRGTVRGGEGEVVGPPSEGRSTWEELRLHASFPAKDTTVTRETVKAFGGPYEAKRYSVRRDGGTATFWFADALPGPPVKMTFEKDGAVARTQLLMKYQPGG